jgi:predicted lipid-binding transport protein (Tim44 family)
MKFKRTIVVALALPLLSSAALAQERAGDAALGALSGAVVLGPIGALAGAVVGYTAGPSIAHSWGLRRSSSKPHRQSAKRTQRRPITVSDSRRAPGAQPTGPKATPAAVATTAPRAVETKPTMPPVQILD